MVRTPDPSIRIALRDRAVDYVLRHGVADLSLRPVAKALGTNARMLIYHFGSREGLLKAILEGLREREDTQVDGWFERGRRPRTITGFVRWYWRRISSPEGRRATILIFELYALALRSPRDYPGVLQDPLDYWESLMARAGVTADRGSTSIATLLLASTRGLLLDLAATGDRHRINRAMSELLEMVEKRQDAGQGK